MDTGTSNGTIGGPSKPINSCDFRPARPFKIIAGSEDNSVTVFEGPVFHYLFFLLFFFNFFFDVTGPPFKWKMTKTEHQRFVQSVRYSPNGDQFATGGFDGKIFVYDGKTSDLIGELGTQLRILLHHRNVNIMKMLKFYRKPSAQWRSLRCLLEPRQQDFAVRIW